MSIELRQVNISFAGQPVLKDFSFIVPKSGLTCFVGPSGCGKTTLFRCLSGLIKPDSGVVRGLSGLTISLVFQENRLLPWFDAAENVALAIANDREQALAALTAMELVEAADKLPNELSGGMQRRVALARAWAYHGDILLLDEPTTGLDEELATRVMARFKERWLGRPALLITHERWLADRLADRIYEASGPPLVLKAVNK